MHLMYDINIFIILNNFFGTNYIFLGKFIKFCNFTSFRIFLQTLNGFTYVLTCFSSLFLQKYISLLILQRIILFWIILDIINRMIIEKKKKKKVFWHEMGTLKFWQEKFKSHHFISKHNLLDFLVGHFCLLCWGLSKPEKFLKLQSINQKCRFCFGKQSFPKLKIEESLFFYIWTKFCKSTFPYYTQTVLFFFYHTFLLITKLFSACIFTEIFFFKSWEPCCMI